MKFFVHLALDRYGAECLAKAARILEEIKDADSERHLFVWAGHGSPPEDNDYWIDRYPDWDDVLPIPFDPARHGPVGLDLDRELLANDLANQLVQTEYRDRLRGFLSEWPEKLLGRHRAFHPTLVVAGSIADPFASASLLGMLAGLARLRKAGFYLPLTTYAVCGVGFHSQDKQTDEERVRILVAQGLFDLAKFFHDATSIADRAAPPYLIGEEQLLGTESDRRTQIALGGMTIAGLTRSVIEDHDLPDADHFSPFRFDVDEDQHVLLGNRAFDKKRPFSGMGGYAVLCPRRRLSRLLAARCAKESFTALQTDKIIESIEDCAKLMVPDGVGRLLSDIETATIASIWKRLVEKHKIPWDPENESSPAGWSDLDRLRLVFDPVFRNKDWGRILSCYGEERFRAIPLEDWNGAIDELEQAIEQGFIPRRKLYLNEVNRGVLGTFLEGLDSACSGVFARAFQDPVGHEPHRAAHALLGRIHRHLKEKQEELERLRLLARRGDQSESPRRPRLRTIRERISTALSAVPSPAAVLLRLVPVFGLSIVLLLLLPLDLGTFNSPPVRLLLGTAVGLAGAALLFIRHVEQVRRQLLHLFREWFAHYQGVLDDEDEMLREKTYAQLLSSMLDCLAWFFDGVDPTPPIPQPYRINLDLPKSEDPLDTPSDLLRAQDTLYGFRDVLARAEEAFRDLEDLFRHDFQVSYLETNLPEITVDNEDTFQQEYCRLFSQEPQPKFQHLDELLRSIVANLGQEPVSEPRSRVLPYNADADDPHAPTWRRSFIPPDASELLTEEVRTRSSGFNYLRTLQEWIEGRLSGSLELPSRLRSYQEAFASATIAGTELSKRCSSLSVPSLPGATRDIVHFVVAAGAQDLLASATRWENDLGGRSVSIHFQVRMFLSAEDIVHFPNESNPTRALGRAWRAHLTSPRPGKALEPVKLPAEDDA